MRIAGVDFPEPVLTALREGRLVVFAGAGVSRGDPANLPNFRELATQVAEGTGQKLGDDEDVDMFLGRIAQSGADVHSRTADILSKDDLKATALHYQLLRCFQSHQSVRIITTNFDLLFEQAAGKESSLPLEVFRSPALPLGSDFDGIVHLHGSVIQPNQMTLTDADFGRAYLTDRWSSRFLVEVFRTFTVLFVGYSHDDTVMNYLGRALADADGVLTQSPSRFILAPDQAADERWERLGISPIPYENPDGRHTGLVKGVTGLADHMQRGLLDWRRTIGDIARGLPPLEPEQQDLIDDALTDPKRVRFFVEAAEHPAWIEWLENRGHLAPLFQMCPSGNVDGPRAQLAAWLARGFARKYPDRVLDLWIRRGPAVSKELWLALASELGAMDATEEHEEQWESKVVAKWISRLLDYVPNGIPYLDFRLRSLAEAAARDDLDDLLFAVFGALADLSVSTQDASSDVDWALSEVWRNHLAPRTDMVAEQLLSVVLARLRDRHQWARVWNGATRESDPANWHRSAIEARSDDSDYHDSNDVLVDAARDCLQHLLDSEPSVAAGYLDQMVRADAPLLRRIAIHCAGRRSDPTADQRIEWLLKHVVLHDEACHRETLGFLKGAYGDASSEHRGMVLAAVDEYPDDGLEYEGRDRYIAYAKMNWLTWLGQIKPQCGATKAALEQLQAEIPDLVATEQPNAPFSSGRIESLALQSPWSAEELLGQAPDDWVPQLADFKETDPFGPSVQGLVICLREAADSNFEWGVGLADALAAGQEWESQLWRALFDVWTGDLDEEQFRRVIARLDNPNLCAQHPREVCRVLVRLVENGGPDYAPALLDGANELACQLWPFATEDASRTEMRDWYTLALNSAAGQLTEFWLDSLSIGLREQHFEPGQLPEPYRTAFEDMLQDVTPGGATARAMLMSGFAFLLYVDESWTLGHLVPLLVKDQDTGDFQAAWDGLMYGQLPIPTIEVLTQPFLFAARYVQDFQASHTRRRFIDHLTQLLIDDVEDPIDEWIPALLNNAGAAERRRFAWAIWKRLGEMSDTEQRCLWNNWLRRYWENRIDGVPTPLEDFEIEWALNWLAEFHSLFAEAVELALRMPAIPVQASMLARRLKDGEHYEREPNAVADLLTRIVGSELPTTPFSDWQELIEKLTQSNLTPDRQQSLEELRVRFGIS